MGFSLSLRNAWSIIVSSENAARLMGGACGIITEFYVVSDERSSRGPH